MQYTVDELRKAFDSGTFARGQAYAREGHVRKFAWTKDVCEGAVAGSGRSPYRQKVRMVRKGAHLSISGSCSCPMEHNCKHVVALLVESLRQTPEVLAPEPASVPVVSGDTLGSDTVRWLTLLGQAAQQPVRAAPAKARDAIAWVLFPDPAKGGVHLYACRTKFQANGKIVAAKVINSPHEFKHHGFDFWTPTDTHATRMVDAMDVSPRYGDPFKPTGEIGAVLLQRLCAEGRLWWAAKRTDIKLAKLFPVHAGPARGAGFVWRPHAGSTALSPQLAFDDGTPLDHAIATTPALYVNDGKLGTLTLQAAAAAIPLERLMTVMASAPLITARERAAVAHHLVAQGLDGIVAPPELLREISRSDIAPIVVLELGNKEDVAHVRRDYARLSFDYNGLPARGARGEPLQRISDSGVELIVRDATAEEAAWQAFSACGFVAAPLPRMADAAGLPTQGHWIAFARDHLPGLQADGWRIEFKENYQYNFEAVDDWYADISEEQDGGRSPWFDLELGIVVNGVKHPLLPLLVQLIRRAPRDFDGAALARHPDTDALFVQLPDGARVALPWGRVKPILATLGELYFTERIGKAIRLPYLDAARLAQLEASAQLRWFGGDRVRDIGARLHQFGGIAPVAAPAGLQAQLRDYQRAGLAWMQFLRAYGFGGILADDMGLGKTIQTLAHILVEKEAGRLDCPALVVAPTSLMDNWQREAARFAPGLRVLLLHGKDRSAQFGEIAAADIVLTTYALIPRDEETLRGQRFHLLVLDESQYIKNHRAKAAQTAVLIDARHRLCLTGTPLQNHLGELWSQFNFLMPGLLGDDKAFNAEYRKPIEKGGDQQRAALLARRVKPFMLRRTKDTVARELPPKTELAWPVEFGSAQRDLYETVRLAMDKKVRDEIDRKGVARSQIVILDALLKLRQVCCDPRLLKRTTASAAAVKLAGSAKFDALFDLLDTLLAEGRKILVFSQFTSMLALIGAALEARGDRYALLTGDTIDRAAPVAAFQQGDVPLFLISLKAGGVGLNLTAADTVIHFDPWWNPASENQATDRAWRIGQDKPVFVYKLIVTGSVEEKIQELHRKKSGLADALLGEGGALGQQVTAEDLKAIFA
jgi:hypothetical protein